MPIYMDRHDLEEGVNAEHVAHIHQEDLKIEHEFGCKGLTYWYDGQRKTAFCLIKAPNKEALTAMHNKAHGAIPNSIIEVNPDIVESFLGRIEDPAKADSAVLNIIDDPAFRVLLVSEIKFTNLKYRKQDIVKNRMKELFEHKKALSHEFGGRMVKESLFSALISFTSVSSALNCASACHEGFKSLGLNQDDLEFKIGLSAGVPVSKGEGIFQETIETAERLCKVVSGDIIMSSNMKELNHTITGSRYNVNGLVRLLDPLDERFLSQFMDFLETSWKINNLQVNDFASCLGLSRSQLYRKVKSLTGKSLNIFLRDYRLERALELLESRKRSISEVAFDSGFNSPAYFSKCFFDQYGLLPSAFLQLA